ncbi:MAG: hypothetical protein IKH70_06685 [Stomatobaculum sp.]|nr:hypothetical protein [Stomatobaculum sp.]
MKWFRRVISSAVIAAGYTVLLGAGLFLVTAKGTGILELPSYYREHSVSPVFVCGGAAVFAGLLAGLFSWVRTQLDVQTAVNMQNMIRTDVSEATAVTPDPGPARPEYVPPEALARPVYVPPEPPARPEDIWNRPVSVPSVGTPVPVPGKRLEPRLEKQPEPRMEKRPEIQPQKQVEKQQPKQVEKQPRKTDRWERGKTVLQEEDEDDD